MEEEKKEILPQLEADSATGYDSMAMRGIQYECIGAMLMNFRAAINKHTQPAPKTRFEYRKEKIRLANGDVE
jgi:hypothetical protein